MKSKLTNFVTSALLAAASFTSFRLADDEVPLQLAAFFQPPAEYRGDLGSFPSPLK